MTTNVPQLVSARGKGAGLEGYDIVRVAVGAILLAAAGLKTHQLATRPLVGTDLFSSRWLLGLQVQFELVLGVWLLSGLWRRLAWAAGLVCFVGFSIITLVKGIRGDPTCGCFGVVPVDPWLTLVLDLGVVAGLAVCRPGRQTGQFVRYFRARLAGAVAVVLAAGIAAGVLANSYEPARLSASGRIVGEQRWVELDPPAWLGKPLPLLPHINVAERLKRGEWTVVLYHHDCPTCRRAIPGYEKEAALLAMEGSPARVALVEMPPYGSRDDCPVAEDTRCLLGRLSAARRWFAATPVELTLADGIVRRVRQRYPHEMEGPRAAGAWAGSPRVAVWGPAWEAECDFGFISPSSTHRVVFVLANRSARPIGIKRVRSECACMKVQTEPKALPARSSSEVPVTLAAPDRASSYSKRILLSTDDSEAPQIVLRLSARVGRPLELRPSQLDFGRVAAGGSRTAEVTLFNHGSAPVRPVYSTCTDLGCVARIPRAAVPAGGSLSIPLIVRASPDASGPQRATVNIHTDSPDQPRLAVRVRYVVAAPREKASAAGPSAKERT